jgi:uncharacterized phage protein gp47/JayE
MSSYGITPLGFERKPYLKILEDLHADARELFGDDVDLSDYSPEGLFCKLYSYDVNRLWQLAEDIYYKLMLETAEGVNLERIVRLAGIERKDKQRSLVDLYYTGTNGTDVPVGHVCETQKQIKFETIEAGTITDGELTLQARAQIAGEIGNVVADSITVIFNPISGLDTVNNPENAEGGTEIETDFELRQRYEIFGSFGFGSSLAALYASLSQLENVIQVRAFENDSYIVDAEGRDPISIEAVIFGGANIEIANILFGKAGGVITFGSQSYIITDDQGDDHTIRWNIPDAIDIYVIYDIVKNDEWDTENEWAIKEKAVEYIGGTFERMLEVLYSKIYRGIQIGGIVYHWKLISLCDAISGIESLTVYVGKTPSPTGQTNIDDLTIREIPRTDQDKIIVNVT